MRIRHGSLECRQPIVAVELAVWAAGFGYTVGVDHDDIARVKLDRGVGEPGPVEDPDERTGPSEGD